MMKNTSLHLYIIDQISPGTQYGIGTYIHQLLGMGWNRCIMLTVVKIGAAKNSIEEIWSDGVRYLWLPKLDEENSGILAEGVLQCIDGQEKNVFYFNYFHHFAFAKEIKRLLPDCKLILVIHYFDWCLMTNGNLIFFQEALKKDEKDRSKSEQLLYKDFVVTNTFFELCDKIVCLSDFALFLLMNIYKVRKEKIRLIYNALPDAFSGYASCSPFPNERVILYAGRLVEQKGISFLVEAFRILLHKHKNIRLILVGNGDYDCILRKSEDIWWHITLTGKIDRQKVYQLYCLADIGVLPSFNEQCSYVMIEMMMHGLPVVTTDSTGLSEMVKDGYNGYKVHIGKYEQMGKTFVDNLARALDEILSFPSDRLNNMKRNSRDFYLKRYSMKRMEKETFDLLNELYPWQD